MSLLDKYKPDFTLILADRFEMLGAAIASVYMNIPVVHVLGGEFSGTVDEMIRHTITKLSHVHFAPTEQAKQVILQLGEDDRNVFNVGCPRIDTVREVLSQPNNRRKRINEYLRTKGVGSTFDIEDGKFILVLQHPVTTEFGQGIFQINQTLEAVAEISEKYDLPVIMLWPNPDAGSDQVSRGIRRFREQGKDKNFHFFKHLAFEDWVWLMNRTACMVGNSSSGVRESDFIGTPIVNVGTRQQNRLRGKNVIDVGYDKEEIKKAIEKQLKHGKYPSGNLYGDGNAATRIIKILETIEVDIQKKFYLRNIVQD
ncbi:MAG: UDP-N-acetylglucosamine 2-epimerase [Candidatus Hodarchaeota archaeon]